MISCSGYWTNSRVDSELKFLIWYQCRAKSCKHWWHKCRLWCFSHCWQYVRRVYWSPVVSPHRGSVVRNSDVFFNSSGMRCQQTLSMAWGETAATPVHWQWSCCSLPLSHRYSFDIVSNKMKSQYAHVLSLLYITCLSAIVDDTNFCVEIPLVTDGFSPQGISRLLF